MRGVMVSVLIPVLSGLVTAAAQLPPEIMADRYLVRVERLMAEKNHEAALEMMDKIIALQKEHNLTVPDEFHFKYAQIAMSAGAVEAALDSVNKYLAATGREGRFYREAQELLEEVRARIREEARAEARAKWLSPNEMAAIPGGRFQMGCVSGIHCERDEKPVHEVRMAAFERSSPGGKDKADAVPLAFRMIRWKISEIKGF